MLDTLAQIGIVVLGGLGILLLSFKDVTIRRWGFIIGLLSEIPWVYTALTPTVKWGILTSSGWYTLVFIYGIYTHFKSE